MFQTENERMDGCLDGWIAGHVKEREGFRMPLQSPNTGNK